MQEVEVGSALVSAAMIVGTLMILFGWLRLPSNVKYTVVSCALMFVGYQILEFIVTSFIVIAK